jgi:hypothetical protein
MKSWCEKEIEKEKAFIEKHGIHDFTNGEISGLRRAVSHINQLLE